MSLHSQSLNTVLVSSYSFPGVLFIVTQIRAGQSQHVARSLLSLDKLALKKQEGGRQTAGKEIGLLSSGKKEREGGGEQSQKKGKKKVNGFSRDFLFLFGLFSLPPPPSFLYLAPSGGGEKRRKKE